MTGVSDGQRRFVAVLARLCAPLDAESAAKALMAMLPALADVPDAVFTSEAAEFCARKFPVLPSYARLRRALDEWWAANRPKNAIAAPEINDPTLTPEGVALARLWMAACGNLGERDLAVRLDLIRHQAEGAFRYLVANHGLAASIAARRGWIRDADPVGMTPEAARAATQRAIEAIRTQREARQRPDNDLRPMPGGIEADDAKPPARAYYLTGDALAAARGLAGVPATPRANTAPRPEAVPTPRVAAATYLHPSPPLPAPGPDVPSARIAACERRDPVRAAPAFAWDEDVR